MTKDRYMVVFNRPEPGQPVETHCARENGVTTLCHKRTKDFKERQPYFWRPQISCPNCTSALKVLTPTVADFYEEND